MKNRFFRPPSPRRLAAAVLSLALLAGITVSAAEPSQPESLPPLASSEQSDESSFPPPAENALPTLPPEASPEPDRPAGQDNIQAPLAEDPNLPPTPPQAVYTVTFDMGILGKEQITVNAGEMPAQVPTPQQDGTIFEGWLDENKNPVVPAEQVITADRTFTASYVRSLPDFLETEQHNAYIGGYPNGMFYPDQPLTRAEASKIFYALLKNKNYPVLSFPDVPSGIWFATDVGVLAHLRVINGYPNGAFGPDANITRMEFVKMAVNCSTLTVPPVSSSPFSDVGTDYWGLPELSYAVQNGLVAGYPNGTFRPENQITRAEAIVILNRMLGRIPDANTKSKTDAKSFYDVFAYHWAHNHIVEASTNHTYSRENGETWLDYTRESAVTSHWVSDKFGNLYYMDGNTRKFLRGYATVDGQICLFDANNGKAVTGFAPWESYRRYFLNGWMQQDISNLGVVSGPYLIKVYKPANYLIIFAQDPNGAYTVPVKSMICSCGVGTPTGTFYTPDRYRWLEMIGDSWAQWCTQIQGNYLFHSVPNWTYDNFDLEVDEYNRLGETRSLGCIRLTCRDAKWIYDNCRLGTQVYISPDEWGGPLDKPTSIQIPSWHTWDPTDPTAYYRCQEIGCH